MLNTKYLKINKIGIIVWLIICVFIFCFVLFFIFLFILDVTKKPQLQIKRKFLKYRRNAWLEVMEKSHVEKP